MNKDKGNTAKTNEKPESHAILWPFDIVAASLRYTSNQWFGRLVYDSAVGYWIFWFSKI